MCDGIKNKWYNLGGGIHNKIGCMAKAFAYTYI